MTQLIIRENDADAWEHFKGLEPDLDELNSIILHSAFKDETWEQSVYNPKELNIHDLGEFIATERYFEPQDDGFSLQDYLADK